MLKVQICCFLPPTVVRLKSIKIGYCCGSFSSPPHLKLLTFVSFSDSSIDMVFPFYTRPPQEQLTVREVEDI